MPASTQSTDPVQAVIDLLTGNETGYGDFYGYSYGTSGEWPNGPKPDPIEAQWESTFQVKKNRSGPAAYVHSPDDGLRDQLGAEYEMVAQNETINVDIWSLNEANADTIAGDAISILELYANDFKQHTEWVTIRPLQIDDRRAETLARRTDHYIESIRVELMRTDDTGF